MAAQGMRILLCRHGGGGGESVSPAILTPFQILIRQNLSTILDYIHALKSGILSQPHNTQRQLHYQVFQHVQDQRIKG